MVQNGCVCWRGTARGSFEARGGAVVTERTQPPFCYQLRHQRLAAAALRALQRARAGQAEPAPTLVGDMPEEVLDLSDIGEAPEPLDRET
ncbi:MAG TPA: hypothetical protein VGL23_11925 [Chloroflexota bacterium]|jgi:hypothetical protein